MSPEMIQDRPHLILLNFSQILKFTEPDGIVLIDQNVLRLEISIHIPLPVDEGNFHAYLKIMIANP